MIVDTRPRRWLMVATWVYALAMLAALALVRWLGEGWWFATGLLYAPRGAFLLPLPIFALLAWKRRKRLWAMQAAIAVVVLGPLMVFCVPVSRLGARRPAGTVVRVLTLNRGLRPLDRAGLIREIEREKIDVVCFQEGIADRELEDYFSRHWHRDSLRRIASRWPIVAEMDATEGMPAEYAFWPLRLQRVRVRAPSGEEFLVANVHLPTMIFAFEHLARGDRAWFHRYIDWRWKQMASLVDKLDEAGDVPLLVAGDFNMPVDSPMMAFLRSRMTSAFDDAGLGYGYTRPTEFPWIRIDHILGSPEWTFTRCRVGPDVGSDHLPLIAEAVLTSPRDGAGR